MVKKRIIVFPAAALLLFLTGWLLLKFTPYPQWDSFSQRPYSPVLTDVQGAELRVIPLDNGLRRIYKPLEDYPDYLVDIFIAAEDHRFFYHPGVDVMAILRAAKQNADAGRIVSGASTIPMQLAGMAEAEAGDVNLHSKLTEAYGALRLEARYSKQELLEIWLASLPFGHNVEGAAAAARHYFGTEVKNLSPEQALLLAVIPRRPELYSPSAHPDEAVKAALALSLQLPYEISEDRLRSAAVGAADSEACWPNEAPHFVNWVQSQLTPDFYMPGLPVRTTLNLETQHILQSALNARVETAGHFRISNGAGLIVDAHSGGVLAWVGSTDFYNDSLSGQIDGVRIQRQPGSTLKPFLYSLALESGFTAASVLPDIPMTFGSEEVYIPQNYNQRFNGPVRLRTALSSSLNIPAVYIAEKLGVSVFADLLIRLGFESLKSQRNSLGVGIALGNAEVSLFELVQAYSVFPGNGIPAAVHWQSDYLVSGSGSVQTEVVGGDRIFSADTMFLIRDILSDNVSRILAFGRRGMGTEGFDAMLKTGTSNQFNNIWAVGATPSVVCGIWMGNFSGETVIGSPGSGLPAEAVTEVLGRLQRGEKFPQPAGLHMVEVCPISGGAVTEACPSSMSEWFRIGEEPEPCSFHRNEGGMSSIVYPPEYSSWAQMYGIDFKTDASGTGLSITAPADGSVFFYDSTLPAGGQAVPVEVQGRGAAVLSVNGKQVTEGQLPLRWFLPVKPGTYILEAETADGKDSVAVKIR